MRPQGQIEARLFRKKITISSNDALRFDTIVPLIRGSRATRFFAQSAQGAVIVCDTGRTVRRGIFGLSGEQLGQLVGAPTLVATWRYLGLPLGFATRIERLKNRGLWQFRGKFRIFRRSVRAKASGRWRFGRTASSWAFHSEGWGSSCFKSDSGRRCAEPFFLPAAPSLTATDAPVRTRRGGTFHVTRRIRPRPPACRAGPHR